MLLSSNMNSESAGCFGAGIYLMLRRIRGHFRVVFLALLVALGIFPETCFGIGHDRFVTTKHEPGDFILVENGAAAPFSVDGNDYPGVTRAANDLTGDILRVTGVAPRLLN